MSEMWMYAYVRGDKENKVRVRQCAAGSDMFVSDTEDYYKVTELEFAPMDVDPSCRIRVNEMITHDEGRRVTGIE